MNCLPGMRNKHFSYVQLNLVQYETLCQEEHEEKENPEVRKPSRMYLSPKNSGWNGK